MQVKLALTKSNALVAFTCHFYIYDDVVYESNNSHGPNDGGVDWKMSSLWSKPKDLSLKSKLDNGLSAFS